VRGLESLTVPSYERIGPPNRAKTQEKKGTKKVDLALTLTAAGARRRQLENQLREAIRSGRLAPDVRLPSSRVLAEDLGVSRGVVVEAYSQLVAEGRLVARRGAGTRVARLPQAPGYPRERPRDAAATVRYDLRPGRPDPNSFPRAAWQRAIGAAARELPDEDLGYADGRGLGRLREELAGYLGRARGVAAAPEQIVVCCGIAHGVAMLLEALRARGIRTVAIEDPCWRRQRDLTLRAGLRPLWIDVDEDGIRVDLLEASGADVVAVTPAHQFPTGVVMAPERRAALVEWARAGERIVIEDDYDAEFRYGRDAVAAVHGLAPENVVYAGTASKTVAPSMRLAWLVLPAPLADDVATLGYATGATPSAFTQWAFATLLEQGEIDRHLRRTRRLYRRRRDALVNALERELPGVRIGGVAAGLHLVAYLPAGHDEQAVAAEALRRGVAVHTPSRDAASSAPGPPALLLGYARHDEAGLRAAARALGRAVKAG
jgi:GntR family transcriptional regulator/MocR family aminotransferase